MYRMRDTYRFFTATIVERKCLHVKSHVLCLFCYFCSDEC